MQAVVGSDGHLPLTITRLIQFLKISLCYYKQNNLIINPNVLFCVGLSGYNQNGTLNYKLKDSHFPGESITKPSFAPLS